MRPAHLIAAIPLAIMMGVASEQVFSSDSPASAAAPAAAKSTSSAPYTTESTPLGTLLDDPAAKAILEKDIPSVVGGPEINQARNLTLRALQKFAPDLLTDDMLTRIDHELAQLRLHK